MVVYCEVWIKMTGSHHETTNFSQDRSCSGCCILYYTGSFCEGAGCAAEEIPEWNESLAAVSEYEHYTAYALAEKDRRGGGRGV